MAFFPGSLLWKIVPHSLHAINVLSFVLYDDIAWLWVNQKQGPTVQQGGYAGDRH